MPRSPSAMFARHRFASGLIVGLSFSAIVGGGVAVASIPNSSTGLITACRNSAGALRVVDAQAGKRCRSTERTVSWNATGRPGARGATGAKGATGAAGSRGATGPSGATAGSSVQRVIGDGTGNFGTSSSTYSDVAVQLQVVQAVAVGDWVSVQFQANTDRDGSDRTFQYFTFNINGQDIYSGTGGGGGLVAHYNVPRSDAPGVGTGVVNMTYLWHADIAGLVTIKPRQKRSGSDVTAHVYVVNNGDVNPILTVINLGH
jgi:hypothetical protein